MHFKKLLTMFTITFFASSGTMLSINTHVSKGLFRNLCNLVNLQLNFVQKHSF